jgi:S1-C subfamily serine protease
MGKPNGRGLRRVAQAVLILGSGLSLLALSAVAAEINACKYLVVNDFASDPYGIAKELRAQGKARGFAVALSVSDIPPTDLSKTCVLTGSWSANGFGGNLAMRVIDASDSLVAEAAAGATAWVNASLTVRAAVSKIYKQLGYTGYNEDVYRQRIEREYPSRPKVAVTEAEIKKSEPRSHVEGIWSDDQDRYRLGIVPVSKGSGADYLAVVLQSTVPVWQPGEIKAEIHGTASPDVFTCTYFLANKKPAGTTLIVEHNSSLLRGSTITTPTGPFNLVLVRVWPTLTEESGSETSVKSVASGTGFLVSRSGLIGTNWHVVADAKNISVAFPGWNGSLAAEVMIRDKANDLAVLRLTDSTKLATTCQPLPFQLASSSSVTLGERVSTIGYPLTPMLGSNPKFAEGVVSSKSGYQDDPRSLQISAQVQPGSSGSPLFDSDGNIVGIVVATLDAGKVYQSASAIPQNVNFAIKADYLISLVAMVPGESLGSRLG